MMARIRGIKQASRSAAKPIKSAVALFATMNITSSPSPMASIN